MKNDIYLFPTPLPWFLNCWIATAKPPVTQSDQLTDGGSQRITQITAAPNR